LQSDTRYAETYSRQRAQRGYGPNRIVQELKQRGIDDASARLALEPMDAEWNALIERVWRKRFGSVLPADATERARQARYLQYRGFTAEQIRGLLNDKAYGD
jgi:regulatory protein